MSKFSDELLKDVLNWQTKRYLQITSAIDSTQRLIDLSKINDEDSLELEIDLRQVSIDELQTLDNVFEEMTVDFSENDVDELLSIEYDEENISVLENKLRLANFNSYSALNKLKGIDKIFSTEYGKNLSIYV